MSDHCVANHDWFTDVLTFGLCIGLIVSYSPQFLRIISEGSSEGFSPWFLLLGSTSSAAGMLNMMTMQWGIVKCCRVLSAGSCLEATAGVIQLSLQWALFSFIFVLYMMYYPPSLKYTQTASDALEAPQPPSKPPKWAPEWKLSVILAWVSVAHLVISFFITIFYLSTAAAPAQPDVPLPENVSKWATFLGVSSALLSAIQYTPQLVHTYQMKLVGAISIPMMLIQSPGAILMVLSIALRPGTNWTSWITFAVSGFMQASLLVICISWKFRQRRLGIDDFGHPLVTEGPDTPSSSEEVPGLVYEEDEDAAAVREALVDALESAVEEDVRSLGVRGAPQDVHESTPLLAAQNKDVETEEPPARGWLSRLVGGS